MIWSIQVLRFVAALMVVCVHATDIAVLVTGSTGFFSPRIATLGYVGVDIFFVISGLVIAKIAPGRAASEFISSRIWRITPLYFLFAIPAFAITSWTEFSWRKAVATFLLWPATDQMTMPSLMVGWTLCFEMLFYACVALVLVDRRWTLIIIGAYGIAVIFRPFGPSFQFLGHPMILEFLLGVAIAHAPSWRPAIWGIPIGAIWMVGAGLNGVAPAGSLEGHDGFRQVLIFGIPSAMIVYGTLQIKARPSVWTYLGDASYSLYLSHTFVIFLLFVFWKKFPMPPDSIILICVAASLLFAWRIHERFEKPIMALFKRQQLRRRHASAQILPRKLS